jgi:polysaccharide pyruvyl transferase WcaK-like protein
VQYKGYIARMRFFVGARTHATIAAYSNCVPTLVLGYSVKSKGIARDLFGEEKLVLDLGELSDGDKLIGGFRTLLAEEKEIRETLRKALPGIQAKSGKAVQYIKELVYG